MSNNNQQSSGRFGGSRFGSSSNNKSSSSNNSSPFGSSNRGSRFGSRFGRANLEWTHMPLAETAIHITLEGVGDPFHRLLDRPLDINMGDPEKVIEVLQDDPELIAELTAALDTVWEKYDFSGAALLYPWDDNVRGAFTKIIQPVPPPPPKPEKKDDDDEDYFDDEDDTPGPPLGQTAQVACLRAVEPAFVLNMLARTRSNVVVANTPLALEPGFLQQSFICDDPRIVAIARATGCISETW